MRALYLDLETYSSADLSKCGVYRYSESPDFEILLFGYSIDGGEVRVIDLASGEILPKEIWEALINENVIKWAHNAQFERVCLSRWLEHQSITFASWDKKSRFLNPVAWRCTMVWSAYLGLPLSLEEAAIVTGAEKKKLSEGKELIRFFCSPCKPTKANGGRTRNLPSHAPDKWERFKAYNARDVETEMAIASKLLKFPIPEDEWKYYRLDQEINDRGIQLDIDLVREAIRCDEQSKEELTRTMREITDLENPNSVVQMKAWLGENGLETTSLGKEAVKELLKTAPEELADVLTMRQSLAKSSVKKYTAMEKAICKDGRVRGLLQFYGANRTGRFAGRLVQVQNLPQNHLPDLAQARSLLKMGNFDALEMLYDSVPAVLSELIRTAFVPKPDFKFIVSDFSAIEARVIAWLAGESWRNEVFATHGKIYEASASQMFRIPIEEITKGSPLRQKGKIAELALGYGGSVGALKTMGALEMGLTEEELQPLVTAWRTANPNIVRLWWDVDHAATTAVRERTNTQTHGIRFEYRSGFLFITLPSDRRLAYVKPKMGLNHFGSETVTYEGVGATKKWERIESYGPKFVENIVQAISRDILCYAMRRLNSIGLSIVMHVHDEVVIEASEDVSTEMVCSYMGETPSWVKGLLLRADGYECQFYKKD
ncbi:DNA polymerase [Anaerocolumna sp. MB42-C2]|uniref:DNA polymerase n=1 Tax=Anaerocolumna sp. MB42-C2 TaxID=3070997 RepID=UPI0027DFB1B7|nr:DNA polymerase [Anaerocolumna sp. MB42-C2]WMJ86740.1 DNA polymerase [Anaerocolumna sp. MB42-C2]